MNIGDKVRLRGDAYEWKVVSVCRDVVTISCDEGLDSILYWQGHRENITPIQGSPAKFCPVTVSTSAAPTILGSNIVSGTLPTSSAKAGNIVNFDYLTDPNAWCIKPTPSLSISGEYKLTISIPDHVKVPDSFAVKKFYRAVAKDKSGREVCDEEEWSTSPASSRASAF